jgi:hypothetical protein
MKNPITREGIRMAEIETVLTTPIEEDAAESGAPRIQRTPNAPEPQAPKQTWLQWLPAGEKPPSDDELIDRDELLRRVKQEDEQDISPRTLRFWESMGIIPGPVRKRHSGATRALYPWWCVNLVKMAAFGRSLHTDPVRIAEIGRASIPTLMRWHEIQRAIELHPTAQRAASDALAQIAEIISQGLSETGRAAPATAYVRFDDDEGRRVMDFVFDVRPNEELEPAGMLCEEHVANHASR